MSWLRLWHWSRGTPPASSMPSTRFVQSSLITAGTRKKVSSASSCLGQKGVRRQDLVLQAPVAQAEASSSSFEKCSMISVCLAFPPALLLPLCAASWPILGWTDIHSFIRSPNISIEPSAPAPTLSATGEMTWPFHEAISMLACLVFLGIRGGPFVKNNVTAPIRGYLFACFILCFQIHLFLSQLSW